MWVQVGQRLAVFMPDSDKTEFHTFIDHTFNNKQPNFVTSLNVNTNIMKISISACVDSQKQFVLVCINED